MLAGRDGGRHRRPEGRGSDVERGRSGGGGELEPYQTWTDAYNVRVGNPSLKAEYIDSYELGYQANFGRSLWSIETYYRQAHNKIEDVRSVYADNVTLHSAANIGADYALGSELLLNIHRAKAAGAGTPFACNHERSRAGAPAFPSVGTLSFLADCVELQSRQGILHLVVLGPLGRLLSEPTGLLDAWVAARVWAQLRRR